MSLQEDVRSQIMAVTELYKITEQIIPVGNEILATDKNIVCCGVGKMSYISELFSSKLASINFPAFNMDVNKAAHGDLGLLKPRDVLFVFSNSGKTDEIIDLLALAKQKDPLIISITRSESPIAKISDLTIDIGKNIEIGRLGVVPTISTLKAMAISDLIVTYVEEYCQIDHNTYAVNHGSGYLNFIAKQKGKIQK